MFILIKVISILHLFVGMQNQWFPINAEINMNENHFFVQTSESDNQSGIVHSTSLTRNTNYCMNLAVKGSGILTIIVEEFHPKGKFISSHEKKIKLYQQWINYRLNFKTSKAAAEGDIIIQSEPYSEISFEMKNFSIKSCPQKSNAYGL